MEGQALIFLICITTFLIERSVAGIFDVTCYGAFGDGVHDDTQAFKQVWRAACSDENPSILIPSERSFLVGPITFQGPCKSANIHLQLLGSIVAPKDQWHGQVVKMYVGFILQELLVFLSMVLVLSMAMVNDGGILLAVPGSTELALTNGDDCIGINTGCSDINITGLRCGPGHGISIGSLGPNNTFANVENVYITNCHLEHTQNGVRIKTWQGGSGYARSIHFENINLKNVENPIIIDQNYCNGGHSCQPQVSAVKVSNVTYKKIYGTTSSKLAIKMNCSNTTACTNVELENIYITSVEPGKKIFATCNNVKGKASSNSPHVSCLSQ